MSINLIATLYLISGVLFILSLNGLSSPKYARRGNYFGIIGMIIAVLTTLLIISPNSFNGWLLLICGVIVGGVIGAILARKVSMTSMPQLVAGFHSLVGLSAVCVASSVLYSPSNFGLGETNNINTISLIEMAFGASIGSITFAGSLIAFLKLQGIMSSTPIILPIRHIINIILGLLIITLIIIFSFIGDELLFWLLIIIAMIFGFLIIIPIGGADMPVIVSMLNSYSGWAAVGIGFTLGNIVLIITGALVGSSGAILSYIMCKAMNRSFISVVLGGFGKINVINNFQKEKKHLIKQGSADDAAFIMKNANKIIIVPGYGMAVSQAQHALREMTDILKKNEVKISFAIHPVAGRMPGHMNVLLAEANISYDEVFELEDINNDFAQTDVAFIVGANDITNPAAKTDIHSPIYGMPILDVEKVKTILFVKRGIGEGYAGIPNELFFKNNTMMLFADAKKMIEDIIKSLKNNI